MAESIGAELMESLMLSDYCDSIDLFARDAPTVSDDLRAFKKRNVNRYNVDTATFYTRKGNPIPGRMYSLFGKYNGCNEVEVRDNLITWAQERRDTITKAAEKVLSHDKKNISWWYLTTMSNKNPCDEIALWCLCKQYFRHAVVYTPYHTWTTLQDKTLSAEQIDQVCDLHFVYMGYGKFGHITHKISNEPVKTADIQPSIRSTTRKVLTATENVCEKRAIARIRHGQHPPRNTSAHIDYCNLNKGISRPRVKSPTKGKKRCSVEELTLREPSSARLAAQEHIIAGKQSESTHQLPPVPGQIIGTAVKSEDIKLESEQDERERYKKILGERKRRKTTPSKDVPTLQTNPEPQLYTHAHGHVCSRKDCTPIILSKRGIIKPNRPSTGHFHMSNIPCNWMTKNAMKSVNEQQEEVSGQVIKKDTHAEDEHHLDSAMGISDTNQDPEHASKSVNTPTTTEPLTEHDNVSNLTHAANSANVPTTNDPHDNVTNLDTDPVPKSVNVQTTIASDHDEQDEHNAAAGLLLLQQMANMDLPDAEEDEPLIPLVPNEPDLPTEIHVEPTNLHENTAHTAASTPDSDDTVIYDSNKSPSESVERPAPSRKGVLTITEVGIRSSPTGTNDPVGPVTNEGKLCCDFCKRSFDTRSEKLQHIKRRHPFQTTKITGTSEPSPKTDQGNKNNTNTKSTNQANKTKQRNGAQSVPKNKKRITTKPRSSSKPTLSSVRDTTKSTNTKKRAQAKTTRIHNYNCPGPGCNRAFETQSELNVHYKKRHPPVQCSICKKVCATPNTLDRHMYKHKPRQYKCKYCDQSFAFKSELDGHTIVHQGEPGFFCDKCDKSFMRYPDLAAHERTHTGDVHKCTVEGCGYNAKDIRYLKIHVKTTHSEKEHYLYPCELCKETFKFYEQRKRHYNNYH